MEFNEAYESIQGTLYKIVKKYNWAIGSDVGYEDLVGAANEGVVKAWNSFDPNKAKWNTHTHNHINWSILNLINRYSTKSEEASILGEHQFGLNEDGYDIMERQHDDAYIEKLNELMIRQDMEKLPENEQKIVQQILDGYDIKHIAKSQKLSKIKLIQKYEKECN